MARLTEPQALSDKHNVSQFNSTEPTLNIWLQHRALKNEDQSSRTYGVIDNAAQSLRVVGFYCLSTGAINHQDNITAVKRNMPNPIPACILGRLAVDSNYTGSGISSGMLKDAITKTLVFSKHVGVRALLVHTLSQEAKAFYLKFGFKQSPTANMTLMISINNRGKIQY